MMKIPKGNLFLKETELVFDDITIMLENLKANGFSGYVKFDLEQAISYLFYREGIVSCAVEKSSNKYKMLHESMLDYKLRNTESRVSSYILSSEMVDILSSVYTYNEVYINYQVRKKEFKKVLEMLEQNRYTGVMEVQQVVEPVYLLLNKGIVVTDHFLEEYGDILCGTDTVSNIFETVSTSGGTINTYAEKADEIEQKKRFNKEELEKIKKLVVGVESGLLKGGNVAKIDEVILKEWQRYGEVVQVEIQTISGIIEYVKVGMAKNKGMRILLPPGMLKKFKINRDEMVLVKPLYT